MSSADTVRLNWLEQHIVDVRKPLRWGSRTVFVAKATQHDAEDDYDSPLRSLIDEVMAQERHAQ